MAAQAYLYTVTLPPEGSPKAKSAFGQLLLARKQLYLDRRFKDSQKSLEKIAALPLNEEDRWIQNAAQHLLGEAYRFQGKYNEASRHFAKLGKTYEAGYYALLSGNLIQVYHYWQQLHLERPNHWGLVLYGMASGQFNHFPTFIQIRQYLEADIHNLVVAKQHRYIQKIIEYSPILAQVNMETYKLLGRSLMHEGWYPEAATLLKLGQKLCPQDPEVYFHLGQLGIKTGEYAFARMSLKQCLLMNRHYLPAQKLLKEMPQ